MFAKNQYISRCKYIYSSVIVCISKGDRFGRRYTQGATRQTKCDVFIRYIEKREGGNKKCDYIVGIVGNNMMHVSLLMLFHNFCKIVMRC